ncbi:lipoate-protein ligase A [Halovivax ruber XH-70]|uniref:Lipoate-protein ligase A n=1 Tax=Halovivax ruber (strain DSM 18193 / JCM 13892 / XH-70) TaxID=797302 RepID=L0I7X2_HALRX|nr:lipoate--protein ligase family protein [Halovivax ruber]AGB14779.1 lipoate-protein ligase A [Halovivax ruber XH-70]
MTVYVYRGRGETIAADREASRRLLDHAADGDRAVRVWTPHRQVAFGRRDANRDGFERARRLAAERGFQPVERRVGGRAVAYDGETALAFARAEPVTDIRSGIQDRYASLTGTIVDGLDAAGVTVVEGEPPNSFCPGTHSLRLPDGGKVVGLAQRVTADGALGAGICLVDNAGPIADVLQAVYEALDVPFDRHTVGCAGAAVVGGDAHATVRTALEEALSAPSGAEQGDRDGPDVRVRTV